MSKLKGFHMPPAAANHSLRFVKCAHVLILDTGVADAGDMSITIELTDVPHIQSRQPGECSVQKTPFKSWKS